MGIFKMDGKRAFFNLKFLFLILATAILWYFNTRRFEREEDVLTVFYGGVGRSTITYITLVVCNAVYGLSVCEDLQNNAARYILNRSSPLQYVISKVTVCMISSIAAYFWGTLCYLAYEVTRHPLVVPGSIIVENLKELTTFSDMLPEHTWGFILLQVLANGICCGCMAMLSLGLSIYLRDGFLVLCLPCVFFFLLLLVSENLIKASENTESMFWVIATSRSQIVFWSVIFLYTLGFYFMSCILLYRGIKRYEYE